MVLFMYQLQIAAKAICNHNLKYCNEVFTILFSVKDLPQHPIHHLHRKVVIQLLRRRNEIHLNHTIHQNSKEQLTVLITLIKKITDDTVLVHHRDFQHCDQILLIITAIEQLGFLLIGKLRMSCAEFSCF